MSIFHPSIFYINIDVLIRMVKLNCFKHFSIRRFITTVGIVYAFLFILYYTVIFRLLDELLFPGYKDVKIEKPVFIISNPRSGTTYLHRLMCLDEERFTYTLLYHTILLSITFYKIIGFFGKIDRAIGSPMRKFFDWIDGIAFGGWKDIHPMGFNHSEEDEGVYFFSMTSAAVPLFCPYAEEFKELNIPDNFPEEKREQLKTFYMSTIKRFYFSTGGDQTLLMKSVMSTGRLQMILEMFPDARIIYLIRSPYNSVPSLVSMFAAPWKFHSPEIPQNSSHYRCWGELAMDYYKYFYEQSAKIKPENLITIRYDDLVDSPKETLYKIYDHFDIPVSEELNERFSKITQRSKNYVSKHSYSLEQFGFTKEMIYNELEHVFKRYNFEK